MPRWLTPLILAASLGFMATSGSGAEPPSRPDPMSSAIAATLENTKQELARLETWQQAAGKLRNAGEKNSKALHGFLEAQTVLFAALMQPEPDQWEAARAAWQGRELDNHLAEWEAAIAGTALTDAVDTNAEKALSDALKQARRDVTAFNKAVSPQPTKAAWDKDRNRLIGPAHNQHSALGRLLAANQAMQQQLETRYLATEIRISEARRLIATLTPPPVPTAPAGQRSTQ